MHLKQSNNHRKKFAEILGFVITKFNVLLYQNCDNHRKQQIYNIMNPLPPKSDNVHYDAESYILVNLIQLVESKFYHSRKTHF